MNDDQRDAIQHVSNAFPCGYSMMLGSGKRHHGRPESHIISSYADFYCFCNSAGKML